MPPKSPLNLEDLLERLGAQEVPGDVGHRHRLRRALLRSRYFDPPQPVVWMRFVEMTVPVIAGGIVVTAVAVAFRFGPWNTSQATIRVVDAVPQEALVELVDVGPAEDTTVFVPLSFPEAIPVADFMSGFRQMTTRSH